MGFGTVFATISFLFVFAAASVLVISGQESITAAATQVKAEQARMLEAQQQEISILSTSYQEGLEHDWTLTYDDEFSQGTFENTTAGQDSVSLPPGELAGHYTSEVYNTGHSSNYSDLRWTAVIPSETNLTFQLRSENTTAALDAAAFTGPDGTAATYYEIPGTAVHASHDNNRYVQLRAYFDGNGTASSQLQDVTLGVLRNTGAAKLTIENTGNGKLRFEETDVYVDGVRALRDSSARILVFETISDERLWNPGEQLNISVFTNITTSATITLVNDYAKDQAVVSN